MTHLRIKTISVNLGLVYSPSTTHGQEMELAYSYNPRIWHGANDTALINLINSKIQVKNLKSRLTNVSRQMHGDWRHWNECSVNSKHCTRNCNVDKQDVGQKKRENLNLIKLSVEGILW